MNFDGYAVITYCMDCLYKYGIYDKFIVRYFIEELINFSK